MSILSILRRKPKPVGKATIEAVVTRADGTVEHLGVISEGDVYIIPETE